MTLEILAPEFTVCQLPPDAQADTSIPFSFLSRTDTELSLVCPSVHTPACALKADAGWRCLRVVGSMDFSLVGVLSGIAGCLAARQIPVFAVSTFDTDYILLKQARLDQAAAALRKAGYTVVG